MDKLAEEGEGGEETLPSLEEANRPVLLFILKDVDKFHSLDGKVYEFKQGEIVSFPQQVASILEKNGMAQIMKS